MRSGFTLSYSSRERYLVEFRRGAQHISHIGRVDLERPEADVEIGSRSPARLLTLARRAANALSRRCRRWSS